MADKQSFEPTYPLTGLYPEISQRRAAKIAGIGYILIFVLAIFANFVVLEGMIEPDDATATAKNIIESEGLFRVGLVAFLLIFALDVVIAWALYVFFRTLNPDLSLLAAWLRVVYTVFLGVAAIFLFIAVQLLSGDNFLDVHSSGELNADALVALDAFNWSWLIGLVCFGAHLILIGYLVVRSGYVTKVLGYLLMIAGIAYIGDTFANALLSNYSDFEDAFRVMVAVPSVIAEGWLGLWLLLRGGQRPLPAVT